MATFDAASIANDHNLEEAAIKALPDADRRLLDTAARRHLIGMARDAGRRRGATSDQAWRQCFDAAPAAWTEDDVDRLVIIVRYCRSLSAEERAERAAADRPLSLDGGTRGGK